MHLAKKSVKSKGASRESRCWAFVAYLLGIVGFVIVLLLKKKDQFAWFHAKQSLVLCIAWAIVYVLGMIPFVGWFIIWPLGNLVMIILWFIGVYNSFTGKKKRLPIIGKYGDMIKI